MLPRKNSWRPWRTKACCRGKFRAGGWGLGFHFLVPAFWSLSRLGMVKLASVTRTLLARPRLPWAEKWGSASPKNGRDRLREEGKMRRNWIQKNAANSATAQLVHPSFRVQKVYVWWYTCKFQSSQQVFFQSNIISKMVELFFLVHQIYWNFEKIFCNYKISENFKYFWKSRKL